MRAPNTGEFLVDYDDEEEGEAWTNINHKWKSLTPQLHGDSAEDVAADEVALDTPSLHAAEVAVTTKTTAFQTDSQSGPPQTEAQPSATPAGSHTAPEAAHHEAAHHEVGQPEGLLPKLFQQLYEETLRTDGYDTP
mgnify:CR=1 FL=1